MILMTSWEFKCDCNDILKIRVYVALETGTSDVTMQQDAEI
jgi:hypothetical protein